MTHSPEPWKFYDKAPGIMDVEEQIIILADSGFYDRKGDMRRREALPDDMRRIVACVNSCRGMPTELLEQIVRMRKCILYDVKMFGVCAGSTMVLDADNWAGNEDIIKRLESECPSTTGSQDTPN